MSTHTDVCLSARSGSRTPCCLLPGVHHQHHTDRPSPPFLFPALPGPCILNPAGELESLLQPPPAEQLERAKAMACSLIQNALEGRAARAEDIGRQFLTYGHRCAQCLCAL